MEYPETYENLKQRAISFHSTLAEYHVYHEEISLEDFLIRAEEHIKRAANDLVRGRGDPWANVLGFPERLFSAIEDSIYTSSFDFMDGPLAFYQALHDILSQAGFKFSWHLETEQEILRFTVENISWEVHCKSFHWIDEPISHSKIEPNLTDFLAEKGMFLYPVTTGDSCGEYILVPIEAKEPLQEFLVPSYGELHPEFDPRAEWLYSGVPEDKRPASIWDL